MKQHTLIIAMLLGILYSHAQTTPVPDPAFETVLINLGIDTNGMNGNILNSDAVGVMNLNVSNSGISNLAGIEAFIDLTMLDCQDNMLTNLSLTSNPMLTILDCQNNMISTLDISANSDLTSLQASNNNLSSISFSNNLALSDISLQNNSLTELDLSNNPNLYQIIAHDNDLVNITFPPNPTLLEIVWIYNNDLTSIDLTTALILATLRFEGNDLTFLDLRNGNNMNINTMDARDNPNLQFICVDDVAFASTAPNWNKDSTAQYSETCNLGISDASDNGVIVYPNPAKDIIYLDTKGRNIESLELITVDGRRIPQNASNTISLEGYSAGLFFLNVRLEDGSQDSIRVIKH